MKLPRWPEILIYGYFIIGSIISLYLRDTGYSKICIGESYEKLHNVAKT